MLKVILAVLIGLFIGDTIGYLIHKLIHWPRAGFLYVRHMTHHLKLYPVHDYMSQVYRSPGKDNTMYVFTAFIAVASILMFIFAPIWIAAIFSAEFIFLGFANDYVHDAFHVTGHWLERYNRFLELRRLHFEHHYEMSHNYGIFSFVPDRLFRTFHDPQT